MNNEIPFNEYFDSIESYFALKRDKVLMLSPEEFEVVEEFYNSNVQLKLVLKGIDLFFEKKKKSKRRTKRPYFLTHVKGEVETVVKDFAKKGVGSYYAEGPTETEFINEKVNELIERVNNSKNLPELLINTVTNKLKYMLELSDSKNMEEIERDLEEISMFAREKIFDILNNEAKIEIEEEIETLAEKAGKKIPVDVIERFKMELIFSKFEFPVISLFA